MKVFGGPHVTLVLQGMAAQAVVHEQLGPMLERGQIPVIGRHGLQVHAAIGSQRSRGGQGAKAQNHQETLH